MQIRVIYNNRESIGRSRDAKIALLSADVICLHGASLSGKQPTADICLHEYRTDKDVTQCIARHIRQQMQHKTEGIPSEALQYSLAVITCERN